MKFNSSTKNIFSPDEEMLTDRERANDGNKLTLDDTTNVRALRKGMGSNKNLALKCSTLNNRINTIFNFSVLTLR